MHRRFFTAAKRSAESLPRPASLDTIVNDNPSWQVRVFDGTASKHQNPLRRNKLNWRAFGGLTASMHGQQNILQPPKSVSNLHLSLPFASQKIFPDLRPGEGDCRVAKALTSRGGELFRVGFGCFFLVSRRR